mgnify:CR=1 FL=1
MLDDVDELLSVTKDAGIEILTIDDLNSSAYSGKADSILKAANINKDLEDLRGWLHLRYQGRKWQL